MSEEYVDNIPAEWNTIKGKFVFRLLNKPVEPSDEVITCFRDGEVTLRSNRREEGFTMSDYEIGYQGIDPGDLVVHGMDGFAGAIGISDSRGKGSPILNVLDTSNNKRYMMYYLRALAYRNVFAALSTGIRVRSCDLRWNKIKELNIVVPPLPEQIKIADYLDHQCGLADDIILNLTNKIDALDQYKKSLIKEKVTIGFNNDDLIDSGVPWIGKIPKHWKVIPNKYCFQLQRDIVGARVDQYERLALTMNGVIKRSKEDNEGLQPTDFAGYQILRENQLVFKLIDLSNISTSRVGLSPYVGIVSPAYIVLQCNDNINERYAEHFFFMMYYGQIFNSLADNGVRANLGSWDLLNLPITVPPLPEQIEIADYLDKKCELIDEIKNDIEKEIEILKEYKKSLIFEYVTGKKVVGDEQDSI